METFTDFLKNFSIKELKDKKDKPYWEAKEKTSSYRVTTLNSEAIMWELKRAWEGRNARLYKGTDNKWHVVTDRTFDTESEASVYQTKLIDEYGSK